MHYITVMHCFMHRVCEEVHIACRHFRFAVDNCVKLWRQIPFAQARSL